MNDKLNSEMIHHLDHDGKRIILVGTAHVSSESVDLVEAVIADVKPDTVCVELCESRAQAIRQKDRWQEMDIIKVIKEKKAFLLLSNLMLASFQKRIANRLEVSPGQEMIQAMNSALAVGAVVHLADRDIRTTLSRTWRNMGLWGKIKLIFQLILSFGEVDEISEVDVEKMKQQDMLASILDEVGKSMPQVRTSLIDERGPIPGGKDPHRTRTDHCGCRRRRSRAGNETLLGPTHRPQIIGDAASQKSTVRIFEMVHPLFNLCPDHLWLFPWWCWCRC
jgi:pheromone shutdown protein TraB